MSNFFLDRPVFAGVVAIAMMLAGGLAIYNLPISQYPPIAPPSIAISAFYPGASAKTVEDSVVQIIEQKMTGLDRMLYMSSSSDSSGMAQVTLTFAPGTGPELAWAKVQKKLQEASNTVDTGLTRTRAIERKLRQVGEAEQPELPGMLEHFELEEPSPAE